MIDDVSSQSFRLLRDKKSHGKVEKGGAAVFACLDVFISDHWAARVDLLEFRERFLLTFRCPSISEFPRSSSDWKSVGPEFWSVSKEETVACAPSILRICWQPPGLLCLRFFSEPQQQLLASFQRLAVPISGSGIILSLKIPTAETLLATNADASWRKKAETIVHQPFLSFQHLESSIQPCTCGNCCFGRYSLLPPDAASFTTTTSSSSSFQYFSLQLPSHSCEKDLWKVFQRWWKKSPLIRLQPCVVLQESTKQMHLWIYLEEEEEHLLETYREVDRLREATLSL